MPLLPSVLSDNSKEHRLLVFQSSLAQSCIPILRSVLSERNGSKSQRHCVLFCLLYPPASLVPTTDSIVVHDWLDRVPGYDDSDKSSELLAIVEKSLEDTSRPVDIVVDSLDTLLSDCSSLSATDSLLFRIYSLVKSHQNARLIVHTQSPSPLLPLITSTSFSASLVHVTSHPPALIRHLATEFLMPPPPLSPLPKFWSVFLPVSERIHDTERLVFGPGGEGSGHPSEIVVELIVREASGRKRGLERVLEGWSSNSIQGSCALIALEALKDLVNKQKEQLAAPDPTQNLSFNLNLTSSQQESRAQVPLPYAHEGTSVPNSNTTPATIFYDPDSADDIDDDDPDEDLDI